MKLREHFVKIKSVVLSLVLVMHVDFEIRLYRSYVSYNSCKNSFLEFLFGYSKSIFRFPSMSRFSYLLKLWSRIFDSSLKNSAKSDEGGL